MTEQEIKKYELLIYAHWIKGFMSFEELEGLYDVTVGLDTVAEIGSWCGKSASVLSVASNVICIDTFQGEGDDITTRQAGEFDVHAEFLKNTSRFNNITTFNMDSAVANDKIIDGSLDLLFIDGNHSYESVKQDIDLYSCKVKKNGIMMFHDFNLMGVNKAVCEYAENNKITSGQFKGSIFGFNINKI